MALAQPPGPFSLWNCVTWVKTDALINRGDVRLNRGEWDEAIADFTMVLRMPDAPAPDKARALCGRGFCRYQQGDIAGMEQDARAALANDPDETQARFVLALALFLGGQVEPAKAEYSRAAAQCRTAKQVCDEGIEDLEQALKDRGRIQGADEILAMLRAREAELR